MAEKNANKIINDLSSRLGVSQDKIMSAVKSGNFEEIIKNTDSKSADRLQAVLSDPQKAQQILNSPQAQAILKLLQGD
jgi:hypothetical protein